ncbi:MAG: type IV pilus twitching motility protein PilT [Armatimonadetes bacterium]|nr:type IV pilus twitching motility protein PilT [Armatimonadota bacterium]
MLDYTLRDLFAMMPELNASDLHIRAFEPPIMRVHGDLQRLDHLSVMSPDDTRELMYGIMTDAHRERFEEAWVLDMAYEMEGVARFRVNVFYQQHAVGAVMRMIPIKIQTVDELGLPQVLKEFAMLPRGLVLVTGPTGSGKSTTLAAMVDHINRHRRAHIVTIEDPIEFVHEDNMCAVEQREVGQDTTSFNEALRHVMRATPDVILVGEMRDLETIQLAITAAETGHLVFGTLHTTDAMQTVDRAVDVFPPQQQQQIRTQLSVTLAGVVCQTLLPRKEGGGRIPGFEIMKGTPAIHAVIREGKTHMLYNLILAGAEDSMICLDQYLADLVKNEYVTFEAALTKSSYPNEFTKRCGEYAVVPEDDDLPLLGYADEPSAAPEGGYVHGQPQTGQ